MGTPAFKVWTVEEVTAAKLNQMQPVYGTDSSKVASPTVGMCHIATDTAKVYFCFVAGAWVDVSNTEAVARAAADGTLQGNINAEASTRSGADSTLQGNINALDGQVVKKTGAQQIDDLKTFTTIPVLPAADPTSDNQAARKKYVDDRVPISKTGLATYDTDTEGTQTIPHGLGKIPKLIRIFAVTLSPTMGGFSNGNFDGTNHSCVALKIASTGVIQTSTSRIVNLVNFGGSGYSGMAVASIDATNITLTWTKGANGGIGTVSFTWEAIY